MKEKASTKGDPMSAYIVFYLRDKDSTGRFLEMDWFGRSAWVYRALEDEVKFESYREFDEKIAAAAKSWLGERIEAAEADIAATQDLIDVAKEVEAPIGEKLEAIGYYKRDIAELRQTLDELRAAMDVIKYLEHIVEFSSNARVYVAHECNPNVDEQS